MTIQLNILEGVIMSVPQNKIQSLEITLIQTLSDLFVA